MVVGTRLVSLMLPVWLGCGVEIGEPPDVAAGEDGKGDGDNRRDLEPDEFLEQFGDKYCDECFRCRATYPAGAAAFAQEFGATTQDCYARVDAFYVPDLVEESVAKGRILYNEQAARLCVEGIRYPANCSTFWQTDPQVPLACGTALVGTVPDGMTCATDFDCQNPASVCDDVTERCTP